MSASAAVTRRVSSDDRRRAIAAATRALIVEKGFEGLRTRDIAERVGINIATLHYHVPTKEALIELVCDSMRRELMEQHLAGPRAHLPPLERLRHEFADFREMLRVKTELLGLLSEMMERSRRDAAIGAAIGGLIRRWRELIADILREGQVDGSFRADLDPEAAAQMLIGALSGFQRSPDRSDAWFERLTAELVRAICNPHAPTAAVLSKSGRPARQGNTAHPEE